MSELHCACGTFATHACDACDCPLCESCRHEVEVYHGSCSSCEWERGGE